jgi:type IV secretion system protein TrbL
MWIGVLLTFAVILGACPVAAHAQTGSLTGATSSLTNDYRLAITQWIRLFMGPAQRLFWLLAGLEFSWVAIKLAIQQADFQEFAATLVRRILFIGIFYAILINGITPTGTGGNVGGWLYDIINSFQSLGKSAAGVAWANPDVILGLGVNAGADLLQAASDAGFLEHTGTALAMVFDACIIFIAYCGIAIQFVVTLVESYLVLGAGVILLGFGGSRWTVGYTERYIGSVISVGFKLFMVYLVTSVGMTLSQQWVAVAKTIGNTPSPSRTGFDLCAAAIVFLCVAWKVPGLAAGILGGHSALSGGDLVGTGSAVAAGAAGGVAVLATGGAALAGAAAKAPPAISQAARFGINASRATGSGIGTVASAVVKAPSSISRGALSTVTGAGVTARAVLNTPRTVANATRSTATRVGAAGSAMTNTVTNVPQSLKSAGRIALSATRTAWNSGFNPTGPEQSNPQDRENGGNRSSATRSSPGASAQGTASSSTLSSTPTAGSETASSQMAGETPVKGGVEQTSSVNSPSPMPYVPPPAGWKGQKAGDGLRNAASKAQRIKGHIARMQPPHDGGGIGSAPPPFGGEKGGEGGGE